MQGSVHWRPTADLKTLRTRAALLTEVRAFFATRGFWEVETPVLAHAGAADAQLAQFTLDDPIHGRLYLQTSPEYAMKRLIAAGSGSIFQISRAFRQGEMGRWHNPEFTLVEWYAMAYDHHALIHETCALIGALVPRLNGTAQIMSFRAAFLKMLQLDPIEGSLEDLREAVIRHVPSAHHMTLDSRDELLDLLMSEAVASRFPLDCLTVITDYPRSQAALARLNALHLAERFEVYCGPLELANGFHEAATQGDYMRRFKEEAKKRQDLNRPPIAADERLLGALEQAPLPDCAGVAVGFDRVVMLATGARHIDSVLAFPIHRA